MRVLLLAVITLDGKIARNRHELSDWSSYEDKRLFARTSREAGVVVMGRGTFATMSRPLPGRLNVVMTHHPPEGVPPEGVEYTSDPPARILERLAARGYQTTIISGGAQVYHTFLAAGLVDEVWLTIEPLTFGAGISLLGDEPLERRFMLLEVERLGERAVHLKYAVKR